jgi:NAD(P)-dependent dehydrogenase (short-subunit alcohol dehydrogenase family)
MLVEIPPRSGVGFVVRCPRMDLQGRVAVVTGANTGIGRVTAEELARRGARVVLACRSAEKTAPVIDGIRAAGGQAELLQLDLGDLASVRAAAESFLARGEPLPLLVDNAGLAGQQGTTRDGFEIQFGTNHLGHYLFTRLLLPAIERAGVARIVVVSSYGHTRAHGIDWDAVRKPTASVSGFPEYCVSKLANVLFANELARRVPPSIHTYSLHPGGVATDVWRRVPWGFRHVLKLFLATSEQGARTTLYCATSDEVAEHTGRYYTDSKERRPSHLAEDEALARELWERSAGWVSLPV